VHRAITLYGFVDEQMASGAELILHHEGSAYRVELRDRHPGPGCSARAPRPGFDCAENPGFSVIIRLALGQARLALPC
jgi:hypothetical protein